MHICKLFRWMMAAFILVTAASCKKSALEDVQIVPKTRMKSINLHDLKVIAGSQPFSIDINQDGRKDLAFTTQLIGDPVYQVDKIQFLVVSNIDTKLPVNNSEEVPVMDKGKLIPLGDFNDYHWYDLSSVVLVQKVISVSVPPVWEGSWKNATHKYLPFQLLQNNNPYNGWVELTVDLSEENIILHNLVISEEANKEIRIDE